MTNGWTPRLRELDAITPTLFVDLQQCHLRVAYRLDSACSSLRRLTPAKALGLVSHELAERVARGDFDQVRPSDVKDALEAAWHVAIIRKCQELSASWPLAAPPPPERWPGYERVRVHLRRSLIQQLSERTARKRSEEKRVAAVEIESPLDVTELQLRGRPDRVEISDTGTHLVDLKSSWAYGDEIRDQHRDQLLLYSVLWQRCRGEWPRSASVQTIDGARISFPIEPREAEAVSVRAHHELENFNGAVRRGVEPMELARPSAEACRTCDYRVVCAAFFHALEPNWGWPSRSVLGPVTSVAAAGLERAVTLMVRASNLDKTDSGQAHILGIPASLVPKAGDLVAFVDTAPTPTAGDVRAAWSTQMATW